MDGGADLRLEAWSRVHALFMLGAFGVALAIGKPWPVALVAMVSLAGLLAHGRALWATRLRDALPNAVTALRVALIAGIGFYGHRASGVVLAAVVLAVFALDWVDGWLARRTDTSSALGAHFDMEADAFLVLALDLELFTRGQLGAWVLVPGLLRYSTVLFGAVMAPRAGDMPRSRLGSSACGILITTLMIAFVWPNMFGAVCAALGSALVVYSFALSFYGSYLRRDVDEIAARRQRSSLPS
ncbi:MAG TPA: CDP-alcohol phosphatidyltransferase family protein [Polyangiaceae bacterium]|jgi:phosphatidylglycerophosphate synthase